MTVHAPSSERTRPITRRLIVCLIFGLVTTIVSSLAIGYFTFLMPQSQTIGTIRRPEGLTAAPEFIGIERSDAPGASGWSVSFYSVPQTAPDTLVAALSAPISQMPAWVQRRFEPYASTDPWPTHPPFPSGNVAIEVARTELFGWPLPALWYGFRVAQPYTMPPMWINDGAFHLGTRPRWNQPRMLPSRPIWSGLIINTLTYASVAFILLAALAAMRQTSRRKRGLCGACRYDLRATPRGAPCPECGTPAHRCPPHAVSTR